MDTLRKWKDRYSQKAVKLVALLLCLVLITGFTYSSITEEVRSLITQYYGGGSIPASVYSAQTPQDIIKALNDPYSEYITYEEFVKLLESINMEFSGIGVSVESVPEGILVLAVFRDSGAMAAGIQEGDIITAAGGVSLKGLSLEEAIQYVVGKEGTTVNLKILRDSTSFTVNVMRSKLTIPTVEWELLENQIGYIRLYSFGEKTGSDFALALKTLSQARPVGYIVDVRNNTGGFVNTALEVASAFIGNQRAVTFKGAGDTSFSYQAGQPQFMVDRPVLILANRYSASASELLLGAVKDHRKGIIIGENSYGKGTMQDFFSLSNDDILKLTVARFFSPNGSPIHKVGVLPHIQTEGSMDEQAALLLLGSSAGLTDKRGFIKYTVGAMTYEMDLRDARLFENWKAYEAVLKGLAGDKTAFQIGTRNGWKAMPQDFWSKPWMLYYPEFTELPALEGVPREKQFTLTFNKPYTLATLNNETVELIHGKTGKRVSMRFERVDDRNAKAIPSALLEAGQTYYLVIHKSVRDQNDKGMLDGSVLKVTVKP